MRSDTRSVTIRCSPQQAFDYVSNVENWPDHTDFAQSVKKAGGCWHIRSPQGDVILKPHFNRKLLLLDHTVVLPSGEEVFIPYRVVPNERMAELLMTNFQAPGDSDKKYAEQLRWMEDELKNIKRILEKKCCARV